MFVAISGHICLHFAQKTREELGGAGQDSGQSAGRGQGGAVQNAEG